MNTEADIIKGCRNNSSSAQQLLYSKYAPVLKSICLRYIKDADEAKDVLHDGFLKIFNSIGKYKGEGSFEGWLKRIVIHVAIDHLKKNKRLSIDVSKEVETLDKAEKVEDASNTEQLLQAGFTPEDLLSVLQRVQADYASVFNMFYIDNLSHKEIASTLGIDENTSRTRLFRARALVKKELEHELAKRQKAQWI